MSLRVAIVGCGKMADQHADAITRLDQATIVGACDREQLMAAQLAERRRIPLATSDLADLLERARPDVVHVTTPPRSHLPIALQCLEAGCHVYVEKPFTVTAAEAHRLIEAARRRGLQVTAGHNLQMTCESLEARRLVRAGYLGGPPVHIESYYTYMLPDRSQAGALLGDPDHWVRGLPGQLLHNIISHGIARISEYLQTDDPLVIAHGHSSPQLRSLGEPSLVDELRVSVSDGRNTTGLFVFSTQLSPPMNACRLYGPGQSLVVDNFHRTLVKHARRNYKSYLNYMLPPVHLAAEHLRNSLRNTARFVRAELHDDAGLANLVAAFHSSIRGTGPLPFEYREILLTAVIMDRIFQQLGASAQVRAAERTAVV